MSMLLERIASDPFEFVIPAQSKTCVSVDGDGDIVIYQDCRDDGEKFIFVSPQNVPALSRAILKAAGFDPDAVGREIDVKDATASERQRRRRKKLRDSHGNDSVTVTAKLASDVDETAKQGRGLTAS